MRAIVLKTMDVGSPTARSMAHRAATVLNSPELTKLHTRGRLESPEYSSPSIERTGWQAQRLTGSEERQLMLRLEELAKVEGLRESRTRAKIPASTKSLIDSKADDSEVLKKNGTTVLEGPFIFGELSSDPDDPDEGHSVMWMSDGTDSGDDGDIMIKITAGGTTKTITLFDFSAS